VPACRPGLQDRRSVWSKSLTARASNCPEERSGRRVGYRGSVLTRAFAAGTGCCRRRAVAADAPVHRTTDRRVGIEVRASAHDKSSLDEMCMSVLLCRSVQINTSQRGWRRLSSDMFRCFSCAKLLRCFPRSSCSVSFCTKRPETSAMTRKFGDERFSSPICRLAKCAIPLNEQESREDA